MCIDIDDWCGKPFWSPSKLPPAEAANKVKVLMHDEQGDFYVDTGQIKACKYEFEINCNNGNTCCRFLLGSDITNEYYHQNNLEWILKTYCSMLYSSSSNLRDYYRNQPNNDVMNTDFFTLSHIAPAYINKDSISTIKQAIFEESLLSIGQDTFRQ